MRVPLRCALYTHAETQSSRNGARDGLQVELNDWIAEVLKHHVVRNMVSSIFNYFLMP